MAETQGARALVEVAGLFDVRKLDYWLGRGRFRHFMLTGEFGDTVSDIDFHILRLDEQRLRDLLPELQELDYAITADARHKLSIGRRDVAVEFVYLDRNANDPGMMFHETVYPHRKRFVCPSAVFGDRRLPMFGAAVRVPDEEYLPCVFGPRWRENQKGSGGVQI